MMVRFAFTAFPWSNHHIWLLGTSWTQSLNSIPLQFSLTRFLLMTSTSEHHYLYLVLDPKMIQDWSFRQSLPTRWSAQVAQHILTMLSI